MKMDKMILYHGTSTVHIESIRENSFQVGTWFALHSWHGFQLAARTAKRDGGEPCVLEVEIANCSMDRIMGRDKPSFRYKGGYYIIVNILKVRSEKWQ